MGCGVALLAEGVDRNLKNIATKANGAGVALLAEGVDRNIVCSPPIRQNAESPSSRRAWIEIADAETLSVKPLVALLAEGVDRNRNGCGRSVHLKLVALLAEGVDRNIASSKVVCTDNRRPPRGGRG